MSLVTIHSLPSDLGPGPGGGELDGGLRLMRELLFDVDDPQSDFLLRVTVRARHRRLVCGVAEISQREGGPPVTGKVLRSLPLESYLREIRSSLLIYSLSGSLVLMRESDRTDDAVAFESATREDVQAYVDAERRRVPAQEVLPLVARLYREALLDEATCNAPTKAVAEQLHYSRGHAARLVSAARKATLLNPARLGVAGEIGPNEEEK